MLAIYARGVARMMALPKADPLSWTFEWFVHAVRNDRSRAAELADGWPLEAQILAAELWDGCEAHFDPRRVDYFLPWHRLYTWRIERIVRRLTGEPHFTMPYWNYIDPASRALPEEFRLPGNPFWGPLYRAERNPWVNGGAPIDRDGEAAIDLGSMMSAAYSDTGDGDAGLSFNLDNAPHASVHIDVGTRRRGMATVAWAADDPIFWPHHAAIDRIWASWNRAGGQNPREPGFLATEFAFIDEAGRLARSAVGDGLATEALGYVYDNYLERPAGSLPFRSGAPAAVTEHAAARGAPTRLEGALSVTLNGKPDFWGRMRDAAERGRPFVLRLGGVRIARQPGVCYRLYLTPDPASATVPDGRAYVGAVNAFGATPREGATTAEAFPRAYSFVVTERVRGLLAEGRLGVSPVLAIEPTGTPASDGIPTIDEIVLLSSA